MGFFFDKPTSQQFSYDETQYVKSRLRRLAPEFAEQAKRLAARGRHIKLVVDNVPRRRNVKRIRLHDPEDGKGPPNTAA